MKDTIKKIFDWLAERYIDTPDTYVDYLVNNCILLAGFIVLILPIVIVIAVGYLLLKWSITLGLFYWILVIVLGIPGIKYLSKR